ncbi:hypothetical protein H4R26_000082 [Coemansia thaxteri]|uniref:Rad60/SUMO-like domain-containing protein n=1 Tax=Coemansia thaxteri TaxID=2663907 RepID=A0A9W8BKR5_9FUNG|nr:hypothetical protein H4R26_000082 [Coemansia thaxteri]KAJ2488146.1 hypothetical protein EV174_000111 [Coemansia sp. RSA 2320]
MSYVISDSDADECHEVTPRPSFRPRVVKRPTPVRAGTGSRGNNKESATSGARNVQSVLDSDDSGSDDTSFFRLSRPNVEPTSSSDESNAGSSSSRVGNQGKGVPVEADKSHRAPTSAHLESYDCSSGSSEDSDVECTEKKRMPNSPGVEGSSRKRSRSVSLTPPPMQPPKANPVTDIRMKQVPKKGASNDDVCVLDSDSDIDTNTRGQLAVLHRSRITVDPDLDPALQAIALASSQMEQQQKQRQPQSDESEAEKAQIEFTFVHDHDFIVHDLPRIWENRRWGQALHGQLDVITKRLDVRLGVVVFMTDTMEKALQAFSDHFCVNVMATDPVLMLDSMRVFATSTINSLGSRPAYYVSVYPRSVYNRERERQALERAQRAMEQEQAQRSLEIAKRLQQSAAEAEATGELAVGADDQDPTSRAQGDLGAPPGDAGKSVRIKVRDKSGKDALLLVATTTSVQSIINNYISVAGLDKSTAVVLEFDDERLDPSATIGDTEVEDDDMLMAIWK